MTKRAKQERTPDRIGFLGGGALISEAETNGDYCLLEVSAPPGDRTPLHIHHDDDEGFYLLAGRLELYVGDDVVMLEPGQCALAPRGIPHTWHVVSDIGARWLNVSNGGLERFARAADLGGDMTAIAAAHAIEIHGPPGTLPGG